LTEAEDAAAKNAADDQTVTHPGPDEPSHSAPLASRLAVDNGGKSVSQVRPAVKAKNTWTNS